MSKIESQHLKRRAHVYVRQSTMAQVERNTESRELQRLHQGTFRGSAGLIHKTSETTAAQLRILRALDVDSPPAFPALTLAA